MSTPETASPRRGLATESVAVLLVATLITGLLLGLAFGRRQGMTIKQVELPPEAMNGSTMSGAGDKGGGEETDEEAMKASAPKAPQTLEEARTMVGAMGDAPVDELLALGDRKLEHGIHYLAAAFYEKALATEPAHPKAWLHLGQAYLAVGEKDKAREAFDQCLANKPDSDTAAAAHAARP